MASKHYTYPFGNLKRFIILNLGISLVLVILFCPTCFFELDQFQYLLPSFINSFLLSSSLSYGGLLINKIFDKKFSWVEKPITRLIGTLATYTIYSFIVSFIVISIYVWIRNPQLSFGELNFPYYLSEAVSPTIIAVVVNAIFTTRSWLFEWRNSVLEAEQLKRAVLAGQNQSLKDQLNPHFLFNSLNTLSSLVYESAERSDKFIQSLSKIYRYVLEVQQEELVSLEKELGFAKNYLELQKIRFEDKMIFEISISSTAGKNLPPLSLQLLLENAVKHTVATTKNPLKIEITEEGQFLVVKNNWKPKNEKSDGVGIGLENIKKRYQLLSKKAPIISQDENFFTVKLPLLNISK